MCYMCLIQKKQFWRLDFRLVTFTSKAQDRHLTDPFRCFFSKHYKHCWCLSSLFDTTHRPESSRELQRFSNRYRSFDSPLQLPLEVPKLLADSLPWAHRHAIALPAFSARCGLYGLSRLVSAQYVSSTLEPFPAPWHSHGHGHGTALLVLALAVSRVNPPIFRQANN